MTIKYNATGKDRKKLAQYIADYLEVRLEYKGAPTFEYQAGYCTISKDSTLTFDDSADADEVEGLLQGIALEAGFSPEVDESPSLTITVGLAEDDTETFDKVQDIVTAKQTLLKHALGIDRPIVERTEEGIGFLWLHAGASPDENLAFSQLASAIVIMAKNQQRVVAKERPVENEKYAFRCFLLRLGFIGDEFKTSRKILLKNFEGSSAYKTVKEAV